MHGSTRAAHYYVARKLVAHAWAAQTGRGRLDMGIFAIFGVESGFELVYGVNGDPMYSLNPLSFVTDHVD